MGSIITKDLKHCFVCGCYGTEIHHCFGGARRKRADADGLIVGLCKEHHTGTYGVHGNRGYLIDSQVKQYAQLAYEDKIGTREQFIAQYGKNYLASYAELGEPK